MSSVASLNMGWSQNGGLGNGLAVVQIIGFVFQKHSRNSRKEIMPVTNIISFS